ncbi:MAG: RnfABCDGE type electron transport complex subunit D [Dorea sp.]
MNSYKISSSPHIRAKDTSAKIMLYVIIALLPASIFGVYNFGSCRCIVIDCSLYQHPVLDRMDL